MAPKLFVSSLSVVLALTFFCIAQNVAEGRPAVATRDVKLEARHFEDPNTYSTGVQVLKDLVTSLKSSGESPVEVLNFCSGYCGVGCPCKCAKNPCTCCSASCCPSRNSIADGI